MGRISQALVPAVRSPRAIAVREQQRATGPGGEGLVKWALSNSVAPADLVKAVQREAARTTDISDLAARITGLDPTMGAPFASGGDNRLNAAQMGPGEPARPFPLGGEPRQWQYRVGWNFPTPPDTDRGVDGDLLRVLADSFDLLRLCIEIRKSDLAHLAWDVVPREKNRGKREQWLKRNAEALERIKQFFAWPEAYMTQDAAGNWVRRGKVKWGDWLGALLEEFFVGDWLTVWPRTLRSGDLLCFDRVDGSTIKPLLDLDGRIPEPPTPAYQQYLYGVPRASFTLDELIYRPRLLRNQTPYGFSHVEQMLVLINLALRFQMWTTQAYTDGSLPLGLLEFPDGYSPDQIQAVVEELNAAISGLAGARQQFHGVPAGTKWNAIKPFEWDETFAQYVVEYTAAMFRLNAQKLGFMPGRGGQGLGGKGFAEQQARNDEDKATVPDARWIEALMNELIERYFNRADIEFVFTDLAEDNEKEQIETDQAALFSGTKSLDQILQEAGEDPVGVDRFVVIGNVPWSIADLKAIQDPAGDGKEYERQPAPGIPIFDDGEEPAPPQDGGAPGGLTPPPGAGGLGRQPSPAEAAPKPPAAANGDEHQGVEPAAHQARRKPAGGSSEDVDEEAEKTFDTSSGMQPHGLVRPDVDELRRWKRMATKAAKEGRRVRPFVTDRLPDMVKTTILDGLERADDVLDVRAVFDREIARLEKAAHPLGPAGLAWANYRAADTLTRDCGTCSFFTRLDVTDGTDGRCGMFDTGVRADYVCDHWQAGKASRSDGRSASEVTHAGLVVRAADTGRILMLQRSIADEDDPARGTWEFPGGGLEAGETPLQGAIREWQEETGCTLPSGTLAGDWRTGTYEGFVYVVEREADIPLNPDPENRRVVNPDDPDGDDVETVAWWAPSDARANPALREECNGCDWAAIGRAVPDATFKVARLSLGKRAVRENDSHLRKQRTERHERQAAAAVAAVYARKARAAKKARPLTQAEVTALLSLDPADIAELTAALHDAKTGAYLAGANRILARIGLPPLAEIPKAALQQTLDQASREVDRMAAGYHANLANQVRREADRAGDQQHPAVRWGLVAAGLAPWLLRQGEWRGHSLGVTGSATAYNLGALDMIRAHAAAPVVTEADGAPVTAAGSGGAPVTELGRLKVQWQTAEDDRVCPECDELDGQVFWADDATDLQPLHDQCRCEWNDLDPGDESTVTELDPEEA